MARGKCREVFQPNTGNTAEYNSDAIQTQPKHSQNTTKIKPKYSQKTTKIKPKYNQNTSHQVEGEGETKEGNSGLQSSTDRRLHPYSA